MRGTSIGTMRYLFFGVGLVGGLILLAAGETLIGGLLVAMAAVRLVLLVSMQRRMGSSSSPSRGMNGRPAVAGDRCCSVWRAWSSTSPRPAIGVAPEVLRSAVNDGRSISAVAADAGVPSTVWSTRSCVTRTRRSTGPSPTAAWQPTGRACSALDCRIGQNNSSLQTPKMLAGTGSGAASEGGARAASGATAKCFTSSWT